MNVNDLVQFGLKGTSAASDINFIKGQPAIATQLCEFFKLNVDEGQPTIQAAQYAVNESYRNDGDDAVTVETINATVSEKMAKYRNKLRKLVAPVVEAPVVEVVAAEPEVVVEAPVFEVVAAEPEVAPELETTPEVIVLAAKRGPGRPRKVVDPNAPVVAKVVKNPGAGKGRPKLAAGLSQLDRVIAWVNASKFAGIVDNDRNAAAIACSLETSIPVGSVLVYFSKGIKGGLFT
jgi:hypothetical protein